MDVFRGHSFVFLSSRTGLSLGRVERRLLNVMAALVERSAHVHFICQPDSVAVQMARDAGVEVAAYRLTKTNYIRTRSRVRKYLLRYQPRVAHSIGFEADVLLRMAAEDLPIKVVNSVQCSAWPRRRSSRSSASLRKRLDAKTFSRVDVLTADCAWITSQLAEAGLSARRVMLDPPSVDLARVHREAVHDVEFPPAKGRWIGYAGRLERARGLGTLIAAFPELERTHPGLRVALAGEGPARRTLSQQAKPGAFWLPGKVPSVPAVLAHLDVCCFPSASPGMPTSLLEAAALGRPIVASAVPGIADLYKHGEELLLVPPEDPRALAKAIAELLDDPERAQQMGERARLRTVDEYGSSATVTRYLRLYEELASS